MPVRVRSAASRLAIQSRACCEAATTPSSSSEYPGRMTPTSCKVAGGSSLMALAQKLQLPARMPPATAGEAEVAVR